MASTATTFRVSDKTPEKHYYLYHLDKNKYSHQDQIKQSQHYLRNECTEILQMSNFPAKLCFENNGFVNTVVNAYNKHYNLVIRPDDVWAAIMTQFSFYINKHAEEFRGKFVDFEGKRELVVTVEGRLRSAPYDTLVKLMTKEIDRNLVDPEVKKWILPSFSTTTDNDLVVVGVVFMAAMKKYFDYKFCLACGIPSVTIEGVIEDWETIHGRLEKLKEYNLQEWYDMLQPILQQFINAKKGKPDLDFWNRVAHHTGGGSGPRYISGWITAFCAFDKDGNWQKSTSSPGKSEECSADLKEWLTIDTNDIPTGIVEVDVKIDDNGTEYNSIMFSGHMATEIKNDTGDTVQPTLGWVIALKPEASEATTEND